MSIPRESQRTSTPINSPQQHNISPPPTLLPIYSQSLRSTAGNSSTPTIQVGLPERISTAFPESNHSTQGRVPSGLDTATPNSENRPIPDVQADPTEISVGDQATEATSFTFGSHKDDVSRIQGTPSGVAVYEALGKEVWSYDLSTVTFDASGEVIEWNDYSDNLKTGVTVGDQAN